MKRWTHVIAITWMIVMLPTMAMAGGDRDRGPREHRRPDAKSIFERIDADEDGQISLEEMPDRMKERLGEKLDKADQDGDKKLSLDEFKAALKARMEEARSEREKWAKVRKDRPNEMRGPGYKDRKMPDCKEIFAKLDTNNDQQLSLEEFTAGAKKMHQRMQARMDRLRTHRPGSMDGKRLYDHRRHDLRGCDHQKYAHRRPDWDKRRMHRMDPEMAERMREKMDERFKKADANGDGKLSLEEAPERLKNNFEQIDADGDGQLTREELKKALKSRWEKGRDGKHHHSKQDPDDPYPPRPSEL